MAINIWEYSESGYLVANGEEDAVSEFWKYDENGYLVPLETPRNHGVPARLVIVDNQDGETATATISGGTDGVEYIIYVSRNQTKDWTIAGSRIGNGTLILTLPKGEYIATVIGSEIDVLGQMENFWVSTNSALRIRQRDRNALSVLRVISGGGTSRVKGTQVIIHEPNKDDVTVWAMESDYKQELAWRVGRETDNRGLTLTIPRQTGFPPDEFSLGMTITYNDVIYGVLDVAGNIDLSSVFTFELERKGDTYAY